MSPLEQSRAPRQRHVSRETPSATVAMFFTAATTSALALILLHRWIPDIGGVMLMFETVLPWIVGMTTVTALVALLLRPHPVRGLLLLISLAVAISASPVTLLPSLQWGNENPLVIASQNVRADDAAAEQIARFQASSDADVVALQELTPENRESAAMILGDSHPYSASTGTVAVWSRYPIENMTPLDLGLGWARALRIDIVTATGDVRLYVVHITSVRPGQRVDRDRMLAALAREVSNDPSSGAILIGDFNASPDDRALRVLQDAFADIPPSAGSPPFTWPSGTPITRLDHAFVPREWAHSSTLTTTPGFGSDHRGIVLAVRLPPSAMPDLHAQGE